MAETDIDRDKQSEDILESLGLHPAQLHAQSKLGLTPQGLQNKIASDTGASSNGSSAAATTSTIPTAPASATGGGTAAVEPATPAPRIAAPSQPSTLMKNSQAATEAAQGEMNRLIKTGSGVSQIQNPFLRTMARIGDIAGRALYPSIEQQIPGTEGHHSFLINQQKSRINQGLGEQKSESTSEREEAAAELDRKKAQEPNTGKTPEEVFMNDALHGGPNGGPKNDTDNVPYTYLSAHQAWKQAEQDTKPGKGQTQEENKRDYQAIIGKVDNGGLPTDPKHLEKSLDAAMKKGLITKEEHAQAKGYLAANPTPATSVDVHVAGQENQAAIKKANTYYTWQDESGTHLETGDKVPPGVEAVTVKNPEQFMGEAQNSNIIQKSFNHLAKDDLSIFDNGSARTVLQTALSEDSAKSIGLLVPGLGGFHVPEPAGMNKAIDTLLENHAPGMDDNTRRALKNYIADYYAVKDKLLMVQMAMQGGKMGRANKSYFDAMVAQLPGSSTADSTMAKRQLSDFNETLTELKKKYPDKHGGFNKEADLNPSEFGKGEGGTQRTVSKSQLQEIAKRNHVSVDEATKDAAAHGIKVID